MIRTTCSSLSSTDLDQDRPPFLELSKTNNYKELNWFCKLGRGACCWWSFHIKQKKRKKACGLAVLHPPPCSLLSGWRLGKSRVEATAVVYPQFVPGHVHVLHSVDYCLHSSLLLWFTLRHVWAVNGPCHACLPLVHPVNCLWIWDRPSLVRHHGHTFHSY